MAVRQRLCPIEGLRPILRAVPVRETPQAPRAPDPAPRPQPVPPQVVAEVLSDGSIRQVGEPTSPPARDYETGRISGAGWILWWERRRLGD
jgi:hypothetical protein